MFRYEIRGRKTFDTAGFIPDDMRMLVAVRIPRFDCCIYCSVYYGVECSDFPVLLNLREVPPLL